LQRTCTTRPKALRHVSSVCVYGAVSTLLGLQEVQEDFELLRSLPLMAAETATRSRSGWPSGLCSRRGLGDYLARAISVLSQRAPGGTYSLVE
jgi:hypothetical protein